MTTRVYGRDEDLALMADAGETLDGAARRLGLAPKQLWKWCRRNGHDDLYERLASRQRKRDNQYTMKRESPVGKGHSAFVSRYDRDNEREPDRANESDSLATVSTVPKGA